MSAIFVQFVASWEEVTGYSLGVFYNIYLKFSLDSAALFSVKIATSVDYKVFYNSKIH